MRRRPIEYLVLEVSHDRVTSGRERQNTAKRPFDTAGHRPLAAHRRDGTVHDPAFTPCLRGQMLKMGGDDVYPLANAQT